MKLTSKDVEEILRILDASPYDELWLETDELKLALSRGGHESGGWSRKYDVRTAQNVVGPEVAEDIEPAADVASEGGAKRADGALDIRTSIPGIFYRAPKPGADPFVEVGSKVQKDTVVCIIETMKLMNSVRAGQCGEIVEICVKNGQPIDGAQVLMRLVPENA